MKATTFLALRALSVFLILLFLSPVLTAQVTIKEKVEIGQGIKLSLDVPQELRISVRYFYWSPETSKPLELYITNYRTWEWAGYDPWTKSKKGNYIHYSDVDGNEITEYKTPVCCCPTSFDVVIYTDLKEWARVLWVMDIYLAGQLVATQYGPDYNYVGNHGTCPDVGYDYYETIGYTYDPGFEVGTGAHFNITGGGEVQLGGESGIIIDYTDACGNYISPPTGTLFKAEILIDSTNGALLQDLESYRFGNILDSLTDIHVIALYAWGKESDKPEPVTVRLSSNNNSLPPTEINFTVIPPQVHAILGRKEIPYGDTTSLTIKVRRSSDGEWMDKPSDWQVEYWIVQADTFGFLYNADSSQTGTYLYDLSPQMRYASNFETEPDSTEVLISMYINEPCYDCTPWLVHTLDSLKGSSTSSPQINASVKGLNHNAIRQQLAIRALNRFKMEKSKKQNAKKETKRSISKSTTTSSIADYVETEHYGLARIVLKKESSDILLGETKYYYVKKNSGNPSIEETTDISNISDIATDAVWGANPVTSVTDKPNSGKKLGVYWEKEKQIPGGTNTLPSYIIRLVGRYWCADSIYKVELSTTYSTTLLKKIIEVKKPTVLGNPDLKPEVRHSIVKDVYSEDYNLDELIIKYAGKYGVSPQFLKGQVQKESSFTPGYRWEPFNEVRYNFHNKDKDGQYTSQYMKASFLYAIKSAIDVGNPGIPVNGPKPGHSNVKPNFYWGYQGTIWDLLYNHSSDLNTQTMQDLYPSYNSNKIQIWPDEVINGYNDVYNSKLIDIGIDDININGNIVSAKTIAFEAANAWLHYSYRDGRMTEIAQTRTSASYGFLQILYSTAVEKVKYEINNSNFPENLQIPEKVFFYAIPYLIDRLIEELNNHNDNENMCWSVGWEKNWRMAFSRYNKPSLRDNTEQARLNFKYGKDVINYSTSYRPN